MLKRKPKSNEFKYSRRGCRYCGSHTHTPLMCFNKPRKAIRKESMSHKIKRTQTASAWFTLNPPDRDGFWVCYLQISPLCPKKVNRQQLQLEHVWPKNKYPQLAFRHEDIKPSCVFCNELKKSNTIRQLALFFPNIAEMIKTQEWINYEKSMIKLASEYNLKLDQAILLET